MKQLSVHAARNHFSRLIRQVRGGEEILILEGKDPVARLVPLVPVVTKQRSFGVLKGEILLDDRFLDPLPETELAAWES